MESKEMKVMIKLVGHKPIEATIRDDLKVLQTLVGGLIEVVQLTNDIDIICNEEGKLLNQKPNINLDYDIIVGDVIFCSHDDMGNFTSLTDEQIKTILAELKIRDIIY